MDNFLEMFQSTTTHSVVRFTLKAEGTVSKTSYSKLSSKFYLPSMNVTLNFSWYCPDI